jgi:Na+-driven multidrug efflux pump
MIQHVISVFTWLVFFLYIEHLGEQDLAVSNIVRSVSGLLWMILAAFSSTCSTLVSNIIGAGRQDKVMSLIKRILKLSFIVVLSCALLFCIFPTAVISIYTDIPELIPATIPSMIVMCSSYIFTIGAMIFFQAVAGTGSTKTAFRLEIAALVIYTIYCTVVVGILKLDIATVAAPGLQHPLGRYKLRHHHIRPLSLAECAENQVGHPRHRGQVKRKGAEIR